jgi:chromosome segregation ATPase
LYYQSLSEALAMQNPALNEAQLLNEIEKLRGDITGTQDLYREVCALLFFRYGVAPTANKLYQLVRKGSMSAPAEALSKFWSDLREKSRVRIEHPDLPDNLKTAAGELTATLWTAAQAAATESLAAFKGEAQAAIAEAKATTEIAQAQLAAVSTELEKSRREHAQAKEEITRLQQELAAERATLEEVRSQVTKAGAEIVNHQQAQESARRYFTEELEKLKTASQLDKERYAEAERRFLQETDRERQIAIRLQKEIDQARLELNRLQEQRREDDAVRQGFIGDLKHQIGVLEGRLQSVTTERDRLSKELHASQSMNNQLVAIQTQLQGEIDAWRTKARVTGELSHRVKSSSTGKRTKVTNPKGK